MTGSADCLHRLENFAPLLSINSTYLPTWRLVPKASHIIHDIPLAELVCRSSWFSTLVFHPGFPHWFSTCSVPWLQLEESDSQVSPGNPQEYQTTGHLPLLR